MSLAIPPAKIQSFTHFIENEFRKLVKIALKDQRMNGSGEERRE
jgi:hypothetical protein